MPLSYIILTLIIISVLLGLWRGFIKEAISFGAWVGAFIVAFLFIDDGATYLTQYINIASVRIVLAFGFLFIITLIIGGLVNLIVAQIRKQTELSVTDRVLGLGFGFLRGVAVSAVLVLSAGLTPIPENTDWANSSLLLHFQEVALWLRSFFPLELAENFKFP
jgi:membrane protein required for colicin V production